MTSAPATSAAIDAALDHLDDDEPEQLGLFGEAQTEAGRRLQDGRPLGEVRRRGKGRRTERTIAWLLGRHRDPRVVLLEIAEANVHDLAQLLGCKLHEAMQEKRLAAIGVLPYVAQKQPLAIDVTNRSVVYLTINEGSSEASGEGVGLSARIIENVQYQEVSEGDDDTVGQSGVGQSEPSGSDG